MRTFFHIPGAGESTMLTRKMKRGQEFVYRHPVTGEFVAKVTVLGILEGGVVKLGIESAEGVPIQLDPGEEGDSIPVHSPAN